jgi:hypothetical protein
MGFELISDLVDSLDTACPVHFTFDYYTGYSFVFLAVAW